ncbi:hypothetical protein T265_10630 [Opisthorchis viverrini]|uniref:Uncharacterized protein n=1 Tax=Opisthorchis viverrini TaxID=6198 RepID=A0A074ZCL9_OPIVI|nr:hypothetical protein T265_10630 [Opisthorchis viverrini]KER20945.1 hypothetical protein T265_10630 [Opisthorchis viverrini]
MRQPGVAHSVSWVPGRVTFVASNYDHQRILIRCLQEINQPRAGKIKQKDANRILPGGVPSFGNPNLAFVDVELMSIRLPEPDLCAQEQVVRTLKLTRIAALRYPNYQEDQIPESNQ